MIFIGQASALSGASVKAIRYYDRLGLLPSLGREGSYRVFTNRDINTIRLIKQAQEIGFKLAELKAILLSKDGSPAWEEIENLMRLKEEKITEEISLLNKKQALLRQYSKSIRDCLMNDPNCPKPLL